MADPIDDALDAMPARSKFAAAADKGCVGRALALHPDRADAIRRAVERSYELGAAAVAQVLAAQGIEVGDQAIRRHRNGICSCQTR